MNENKIIIRIGVLDSFRAIAALSVLVFHFTHKQFFWGQYGVQLFFIISGFVIFNTIEKIKSGKEFIIKRFLRLYPTYWICLIITTLIINLFQKYSLESISVRQFLFNLTMIQEILGEKNVDTSYWSLQPELFFYAFILILFWLKQLKNIEYIGYVWLAIILLNAAFKIELYFQPIRLLNIRHGQLFLSGILFYKIYKGNISKHIIIQLFVCYLTCLIVYPLAYPNTNLFFENMLVISIIYGLFILFLLNKLSFLATPSLQFLGLISYPIYLIHQKIGLIFINFCNTTLEIPNILTFTFAIILVLIISLVIYKLIESPIRNFTKLFLNNFQKS